MKHLLIIPMLLASAYCLSQQPGRESLYLDSLTLNSHRTWYRTDATRFTKVNKNCAYGMEMIFYKENDKIVQRRCDEGRWKEKEYRFRITTKDENHYVEILDKKDSIVTTLEIQMLGADDKFRTELTYYNINAKEIYTLISDAN